MYVQKYMHDSVVYTNYINIIYIRYKIYKLIISYSVKPEEIHFTEETENAV